MENRLVDQRLACFPTSTILKSYGGQIRLEIADCDLQGLADIYGTPLYIYDSATLDHQITNYFQSLAHFYSAQGGLTYASKPFLCLAIAQWIMHHDAWLDCTGAGEISIASAASIPRSKILVHGVNKSHEDLHAALAYAGTIVVDNLQEISRLVELSVERSRQLPNIWLRFRPGMVVDTHDYTQTGQHDSKFGMEADEIKTAVRICLDTSLPLTGLHFHLGSQFRDPKPLGGAINTLMDLVQSIHLSTGWYPGVICPGGGWGVAYHENDLPQPSIDEYVQFIADHLIGACHDRKLPLPRLQLEPGRSLVARAGVAIYRIGAIKNTPGRRWLLVDGGIADNPRPALYNARYTALPVLEPERPCSGPAWLAGPYCESGDILINDLPLPDMTPGELIAVPASGAYHLSMGSNYNGARRPAVLWLEKGEARLIQRRETLAELHDRDLPLPVRPESSL